MAWVLAMAPIVFLHLRAKISDKWQELENSETKTLLFYRVLTMITQHIINATLQIVTLCIERECLNKH